MGGRIPTWRRIGRRRLEVRQPGRLDVLDGGADQRLAGGEVVEHRPAGELRGLGDL